MSKILLTRPSSDSDRLGSVLTAQGFDVLSAPMLTIVPCPARLSLAGVQALAFTSANGVSALERDQLQLLNACPVYAVGAASAAAAQQAGFSDVSAADGDVASLACRIIEACRPDDGAILHPCGRITAGGLQERLMQAGFSVRRTVVYDAVPATALPDSVHAALSAGDISAVLFFSARSAAVFVELIRGAGLTGHMASVMALCLAPAVADVLEGAGFGGIHSPARPDQAALLTLLTDFRPT